MDNFSGGNINNDHNGNYKTDRYRDNEEVVPLITWIGVLVLLALPFVNFIALIALSFMEVNKNLKNFARGILILLLIGLLFGGIFSGISMLVSSCNFILC